MGSIEIGRFSQVLILKLVIFFFNAAVASNFIIIIVFIILCFCRLYGLTVAPAVGMLMELVKLGPLDAYLRDTSPQTIKTVDMVEATACLATALWHLVR